MSVTPPLSNIPTNIITGALGSGKTTLIQAMLQSKPLNERWAVLVNEFGEVGIDGALMAGVQTSVNSEKQVFIKEVPGGCMCCTSGLPMQIALNLLLAQARPHRLIIEPTGLGHPKEVMQTLAQEQYRERLELRATLTLIDLRKLDNAKWRAHKTFMEQMHIADVIVTSKSDLYTHSYQRELDAYLQDAGLGKDERDQIPIIAGDKGQIDPHWLDRSPRINHATNTSNHHHHGHDTSKTLETPKTGSIKVCNQGEGYFARGWICAPDMRFNFNQCQKIFSGLSVERLKAVLKTDNGDVSFNISEGEITISELTHTEDSRLEFIVERESQADEISAQLALQLNL